MANSLRTASLALCCGLGVAVPVLAEDALPDMALLEYLGSWDESDEDWVLLVDDELQSEQEQERSDPADDEESQESDHES